MPLNVFLSVGRTSTAEQEGFVRAIEKFLESNDLAPKTVGRTYYRNQQPLKSVEDCMKECVGTVIIAFERTHIQHGIEKRGAAEATNLSDVNLPTVWNQIEATMSYTLGLPLFVLVEHGLKNEGLLERGYDWYVKHVKLDASAMSDPEFIGIFTDWKKNLERMKATGENPLSGKSSKVDVSDLTVGQILTSLKPAHLWAIGVAVITLLTGVAVIAYRLGDISPK